MSDLTTFITLTIIFPSLIILALLVYRLTASLCPLPSSPSSSPHSTPSPPSSRPRPRRQQRIEREEASERVRAERHRRRSQVLDLEQEYVQERERVRERRRESERERVREEERQRQRCEREQRAQRQDDQEEDAQNDIVASDTDSMKAQVGRSGTTLSRPLATLEVNTASATSGMIELDSLPPSTNPDSTTPAIVLDVAASTNIDSSLNLVPPTEPQSTLSSDSTAPHDINTPTSTSSPTTPPHSPVLPQPHDSPAMTPSAFLPDQRDEEVHNRSKGVDNSKSKENDNGEKR